MYSFLNILRQRLMDQMGSIFPNQNFNAAFSNLPGFDWAQAPMTQGAPSENFAMMDKPVAQPVSPMGFTGNAFANGFPNDNLKAAFNRLVFPGQKSPFTLGRGMKI